MNEHEASLTEVLYALSDPNRLKIVLLIHASGGTMPCGSFSQKLGVSKPTVSHHFNILREAGVIVTHVEGTTKLNHLRRVELNKRFPGLLDSILASAGRFEPELSP